MGEIALTIDGRKVTCDEDKTVLEAALDADIYIPNLCYHPLLEPYGACRMCIVEIKGIPVEAEIGPHMLYLTNRDKPGVIGDLGRTLGEAQVNIATFHLGRASEGGDAIALLQVDRAVDKVLLDKLASLPNVLQAKALEF